jgi:molybdenum cofactor biosynthesis protein B
MATLSSSIRAAPQGGQLSSLAPEHFPQTMSHVPDEHRAQAPRTVRCAVITVSDTRTLQTDTGGGTIVDLLTAAGHEIVRRDILRDEPAPMRALLEALREDPRVDAILMTGGTGLGSRDQTFETVSSLLDKPLPGYGELFRMLSYREIGPAAMLSRATGGLLGNKVVLTMPGSRGGVALAMEKLIIPELGHLVREARR